MSKLKILTIVGTRPEIIRLSRVISKLNDYCDHKLVHTGQNYDYELNQVFFEDLGLKKPDYFLNSTEGSKSAAHTIGNIIAQVDDVLVKESPSAILVLGDTNSVLSVIAAKRRKIPIFHMEAGNRCFDMRVPEEINRRIVDHISDINLTYSDIAREYLLREGLDPDCIIKTGSPMFEVLHYYLPQIKQSRVLDELNLDAGQYFLVSVHREENIEPEEKFLNFVLLLNKMAEDFGLPIVLSAHPRTRKRMQEAKVDLNSLVSVRKAFGFFDYVHLQMNARAVLSDSGTISEESSILNFSALNVREVHERPEAMEEGAVMFTGFDYDRITQCLEILKSQQFGERRTLKLVGDYDAPNVSEKVVRIIHSHINFVNQNIWRKDS